MKTFNEDLNVAVFTTRFVIRGGEPIRNVFHHEDDGAWEFTGGTRAEADSDYLIVALAEIIKRDTTVLELADLSPGEAAYRAHVNAVWERRKI